MPGASSATWPSGTAGIGGIVFVGAVTANERRFYGTCNKLMRLMCSTDVEENIAAHRTFLRRCFHPPPFPSRCSSNCWR